MEAYVIIGDANTRKSSVLRSLTGCFNRSNRDIAIATGSILQIYARVSSLQESETTPSDFIAEVSGTGQKSVVFCLWQLPNPKDPLLYPDANSYIAALSAVGWKFHAAAVLGSASLACSVPNTAHFRNVLAQPINVSAQLVRAHFGWQ